MKIAHASLPADDPAEAAKVLARIMGGEAMPFPPGGANTWMAWSGDNAIELEIAPRGIELGACPEGANWVVKAETPRRANEAHLAIGVDKSAEEIMAIAREAGWPTARYDRGGFFHVVEVWVEGAFLIEFLDPAETASYRRTMTPENWKAVFGVRAAA
jgi:catechol 2,3-dioxygenase-like lactoylglutathione lyase family enzyme